MTSVLEFHVKSSKNKPPHKSSTIYRGQGTINSKRNFPFLLITTAFKNLQSRITSLLWKKIIFWIYFEKFQIVRHRPEQTLKNIKRQEFPLFLPPDTKLKKQEGSSLNHSCSPKGISYCKIIIYSGYLGRNKCCIENA